MLENNNYGRAAYKYSVHKNDSNSNNAKGPLFDIPVKCTECDKVIVGEHNPRSNQVLTFEMIGYPEKKTRHEHEADTRIRTDVIHQTAVEYRLVHRPKRGDYDLVSRRIIR